MMLGGSSTRWWLVGIALALAVVTGCRSLTPANETDVGVPTLRATAAPVANKPDASLQADQEATHLPSTFTPMPTFPATVTPGPSRTPLPSVTPSRTLEPSKTPTMTPTSKPQQATGITTIIPRSDPGQPPTATPPTAVPTQVPTFELPPGTTNILLLGVDGNVQDSGSTRTDTMILVSINSQEKTAAMMSLPRDLYVYVPGWTMAKLNTAYPYGERAHPNGGFGQLKDTILYNFGMPIHYYARVDFNGFQQVVDAMDGVRIAVSCTLTDWRLKSPELDPNDEENWYRFTLERGIQEMDGDLALWYARSRLTSSELERTRRQHQLLQSMLNQGVDVGLIQEVPALWQVFQNTVETDLDIGRILQLAALAPAIRERGVQHVSMVSPDIEQWTVPDSGAYTFLPRWETAQHTFARLIKPATLNRASRAPVFVEIVNRSGDPVMAELAADNLNWFGFVPVIAADPSDSDEVVPTTELTYFGPNFKGSFDWLASWIFDMYRSEIALSDDQVFAYDYQVVLGQDYDPCRPQLYSPRESLNED